MSIEEFVDLRVFISVINCNLQSWLFLHLEKQPSVSKKILRNIVVFDKVTYSVCVNAADSREGFEV